ncbi:MAG: 23S rRNA (adenine(2503)-C(2))-methyltransferase RlmN [Bacteroidales bacterium]|nr:23S rRNA (adenine(2503)-C(2))-methyltransferase RlmN [Bacteroidales bacterium]
MSYLLGKTFEEIVQIVQEQKLPQYIAKQICEWIYKHDVSDIADMTNLSKKIREFLRTNYSADSIPYSKEVISKDSTRKYLFRYDNNVFVEAVLIFDKKRATLCISSQAGCRMNCSFCATGKMGLIRNLTAFEIINIYRTLNNRLAEINATKREENSPSSISNIVFMGMGEPLDNFEEVIKSLQVLTCDWGYALSAHRITISTCGYIPKLKDFLDTTNVDIAISLHNPISEQRKSIMPIEKAYPITKVIEILKQYDWTGQRHLTFEYICLKNLNCNTPHVNAMAKLLNGLACRINLIPFNTIPDTPYIGATKEEMTIFAEKLKAKGFNVTIRQSKGQDISAACGLLSAKQN